MHHALRFWGSLAGLLVLYACIRAPGTPLQTTLTPHKTPSAQPQPSPTPVHELVICVGTEPESLYIYSGRINRTGWSILEAVYDGPLQITPQGPQSVILKDIPTLENGGADIRTVKVPRGEAIVDVFNRVVDLKPGVLYRPAGCRSDDCARTFTSKDEFAEMDQLVVRFQLREDVRWSDGKPVTADDSVFSFEIASDPISVSQKYIIDRTQSYTALNPTTVQWTALPGYLDALYNTRFWTPLPKHQLGHLTAAELMNSPLVNREPMGWGPYQIREWIPQSMIVAESNPYYFRRAEGLPRFGRVMFKFFTDPKQALAALQAGECDFVSGTVGLDQILPEVQRLHQQKKVRLERGGMVAFHHLGMVIFRKEHDDRFFYQDPPLYFADPRVRQAVALCLDRQKILSAAGAMGELWNAYLPPDHPWANRNISWEHNPQKALELLRQSQWVDVDRNPATPLVYIGPTTWKVTYGQRLTPTLAIPEYPLFQAMAEEIQRQMAQCGFQIEIQAFPIHEFFVTGPDGPVFGRRVDMALFPWDIEPATACRLWMWEMTPGPPEKRVQDVFWMTQEQRIPRALWHEDAFLYDWNGFNYHAYVNLELESACRFVLMNPPETPGYVEAHHRIQEILARDVPFVPLFGQHLPVAMRPDFCEYQPNESALTELWGIEAFGYGELCPK